MIKSEVKKSQEIKNWLCQCDEKVSLQQSKSRLLNQRAATLAEFFTVLGDIRKKACSLYVGDAQERRGCRVAKE